MVELFAEEFERRDQGCDLYPACLDCPLPRCRYDQRGRRVKKELRDEEIVSLKGQGQSAGELAQRFGVSRRTVQRILARTKEESWRAT